MFCLTCHHYSQPDREMARYQESDDCPCACHLPKCSTCGKTATHSAVDILRIVQHDQTFAEFAPVGPVKFGCDDHPVASLEHEPPWPRMHEDDGRG